MTTIAQIDQLITNLQGMRATLERQPTGGAAFEGVFAAAIGEAEALVAPAAAPVAQSAPGEINAFRSVNMLVDSAAASRAARPNMRAFMEATGASATDASELLYGVIGSNADYRDWAAIMGADNPVDAARAATAQLYGSDLDYALKNHALYGTPEFETEGVLAAHTVNAELELGQVGNFALEAEVDENTGNRSGETLFVTDGSGLKLRGAGTTQAQIERNAWLFGLSTTGLNNLASAATNPTLRAALERLF